MQILFGSKHKCVANAEDVRTKLHLGGRGLAGSRGGAEKLVEICYDRFKKFFRLEISL